MKFNNLIDDIRYFQEKRFKFAVNNNKELIDLLKAIELIFKEDRFQIFSVCHCPCGNVFVHPNKNIKDSNFDFKTDKNKNLLCPFCGNYKIDVGLQFYPKGKTKVMFKELDLLFKKAKNDNKFSYYMFISNTFFEQEKLFDEIFKSVVSYLGIIDDLEIKMRLGKLRKNQTNENIEFEKTIIRVKLLIYCHIIELKNIYNLLNNLIKISFCELKATEKEKRKINPIRFNFYNDKWVITDIINDLVKITKEKGLSLGDYLKNFYNNELRNAFYHSQYIINGNNDLLLINYGKSIPEKDIDNIFSNCFNFFSHFTEKIFEGKRELIESKGIQENGYKIEAIKKGNKVAFKYIL